MYKDDTRFEKPNNDVKIWRYMDFEKFEDLLESKCLHFCRGDIFRKNDTFEGSYLPSELLKSVDRSIAQQFTNQIRACEPPVTVNCWHINEHESMAMWSLYSDKHKGIAIQSTFNRLVDAFNNFPDNVYIGKIRYIDHNSEQFKDDCIDIFEPFMTKRKCFEYERELRAIIWETGNSTKRVNGGNVLAHVNLNCLVETLYVAPEAPSHIMDLVKSIAIKYNFSATVVKSQLYEEPPY